MVLNELKTNYFGDSISSGLSPAAIEIQSGILAQMEKLKTEPGLSDLQWIRSERETSLLQLDARASG